MEESEAGFQLPKFTNLIDRYYTRNYLSLGPADFAAVLNKKDDVQEDECLDQYYHMHSNKLVLFGLSPQHAAIKNHATNPIIKIVFEEERTQNITGKQGAITIEYASVICEVLTQSGKVYKIRAFMKNCKQIEFNDRLTPGLLVAKPETEGYLAIFMFKKVDEGETCTDLIKHIYQFNSSLNK